jgi:CMP-2-keto-3-deoxyoctulosonic acid synthetase
VKIIGSVIARLGSKRLTYKNLLPYNGIPLVRHAVRRLIESKLFEQVVLSTDSELIARTCMDLDVALLKRPPDLACDTTASIPVFRHIVDNFPCDIHLNYNCNFPVCEDSVFMEAIKATQEHGESLSDPYAVWAQSKDILYSYGDPMRITAVKFKTNMVHPLDVHTMSDLISVHRENQNELNW